MSAVLTLLSAAEESTLALGRLLGRRLRPGQVVALYGDLGAGKTVLSRGIARGLGIQTAVTSPTFTVVQEYPCADGTFLFHLDLYRIADAAAALAFGIDEYLFAADGVTLVEWPERIPELLGHPGSRREALAIHLEHAADGSRRLRLPARLADAVREDLRQAPVDGLAEIAEEL